MRSWICCSTASARRRCRWMPARPPVRRPTVARAPGRTDRRTGRERHLVPAPCRPPALSEAGDEWARPLNLEREARTDGACLLASTGRSRRRKETGGGRAWEESPTLTVAGCGPPEEEPCRLRDHRIAGPGRDICAPGALRFARSSGNHDQTIPFYRDLLGPPVVGEFADSFGEDGRSSVSLKRGSNSRSFGRTAPSLPPIRSTCSPCTCLAGRRSPPRAAPLRRAGVHTDPTPPPYWVARGGIVHVDPD